MRQNEHGTWDLDYQSGYAARWDHEVGDMVWVLAANEFLVCPRCGQGEFYYPQIIGRCPFCDDSNDDDSDDDWDDDPDPDVYDPDDESDAYLPQKAGAALFSTVLHAFFGGKR